MGGDNTNEIQGAQTFTTTQQELESLEWIYIGKDPTTGRHLITTTEPVDKSIALYGKGTLKIEANGKELAINEINNICKALYSSSSSQARSMTIQDVYRVLEYTGNKGEYYNQYDENIESKEPKTFSQIATETGYDMSSWEAPSTKPIGDYFSTKYSVDKEAISNSDRINIIYNSSGYWLASLSGNAILTMGTFSIGFSWVSNDSIASINTIGEDYIEDGTMGLIRPVVEL